MPAALRRRLEDAGHEVVGVERRAGAGGEEVAVGVGLAASCCSRIRRTTRGPTLTDRRPARVLVATRTAVLALREDGDRARLEVDVARRAARAPRRAGASSAPRSARPARRTRASTNAAPRPRPRSGTAARAPGPWRSGCGGPPGRPLGRAPRRARRIRFSRESAISPDAAPVRRSSRSGPPRAGRRSRSTERSLSGQGAQVLVREPDRLRPRPHAARAPLRTARATPARAARSAPAGPCRPLVRSRRSAGAERVTAAAPRTVSINSRTHASAFAIDRGPGPAEDSDSAALEPADPSRRPLTAAPWSYASHARRAQRPPCRRRRSPATHQGLATCWARPSRRDLTTRAS